ncbi:hypothetical protein HPB50_018517 [Hyalomma asiaticum]|uniref:Uncharacterized protein n=1 Tax=Hyalomma asiaticum TaxID=266040 RepID=A0ACB7TR76_HYAAI|nr:hypothetical protein HPB50_018517 [Hyalomma asiaticum]
MDSDSEDEEFDVVTVLALRLTRIQRNRIPRFLRPAVTRTPWPPSRAEGPLARQSGHNNKSAAVRRDQRSRPPASTWRFAARTDRGPPKQSDKADAADVLAQRPPTMGAPLRAPHLTCGARAYSTRVLRV